MMKLANLPAIVILTSLCVSLTMANIYPTDATTDNVTTVNNGTPMSSQPMWAWWTKQILTPIIVIIGLFGNSLTLVVMTSKNLRQKSYSQFLCFLAIFDSASLIVTQIDLIDHMTQYMTYTSIFAGIGDVGCKLYKFFESTCFLMSSWMVVALSIERVVAIFFPFKKAALCRPCAAVGFISSTILVVMVTQAFRIVMIGHDEERGMCTATQEYLSAYIQTHAYFYMGTLTGAIPIFLISASNCFVVRKISQVHRETEDESAGVRYYGNQLNNRRRKTTRMLLTITFAYVITTLPVFILSVAFIIAMNLPSPDNVLVFLRLTPYMSIAEIFSVTNYSINFFIYVLTGQKFRHELRCISKRLSSARSKHTNAGTKSSLLRIGRRSHTANNYPLKVLTNYKSDL